METLLEQILLLTELVWKPPSGDRSIFKPGQNDIGKRTAFDENCCKNLKQEVVLSAILYKLLPEPMLFSMQIDGKTPIREE